MAFSFIFDSYMVARNDELLVNFCEKEKKSEKKINFSQIGLDIF